MGYPDICFAYLGYLSAPVILHLAVIASMWAGRNDTPGTPIGLLLLGLLVFPVGLWRGYRRFMKSRVAATLILCFVLLFLLPGLGSLQMENRRTFPPSWLAFFLYFGIPLWDAALGLMRIGSRRASPV